ncbi:MAG: hypothetical protein F6K39_09805, partial [Okeania sp. SIO3B3]|nr:hypothetical protein [Okeania sp. SIO3B3]
GLSAGEKDAKRVGNGIATGASTAAGIASFLNTLNSTPTTPPSNIGDSLDLDNFF